MDSQRTIEVEDASNSYPSTSSTILSASTSSTMPPPSTSPTFKPHVPKVWHLRRIIASHAHTRQLPAWRTSDLQNSQGSDISQADPFFHHDDTGESGHAYAIDSDGNRLAEYLDPHRSFLDSVYGKIHRDSTRHAMISYRMKRIRRSYGNGVVYRDVEAGKNSAACRQVKRICLSDKQSKLSPPTQFSSYTQYDDNLSASDGSASDEIGAREYDKRAKGTSTSPIQSPLSSFSFPLPPTDANAELGSPMSEHATYEDLDSYEDDDGLVGYDEYSDEDSDEESDKEEYDPNWAAQRTTVAYRVCVLGTIWEEE